MGKGQKADWDDLFPEEMLRDLDEMLRDESPVVSRAPARSAPATPPPARPAPVPPPKLKGDPEARSKAQELANQARNNPDRKRASQLARKALGLDRNCMDAWVVMAHAKATAPDELAEGLERAVKWAAQGFGKEYLDYYRGKFGSVPELRPYLRARRELADVLRDTGRVDQAVQHYEALLEFDASDSQRVRDPLLACYFVKGYLEGARRVLDQFAGDVSAALAWSRVIERYLAGDLAGATAALGGARSANRWVEDYLVGRKPMPQHTLSDSTPGGDYEARHCALTLLPALVQHPRFAGWLAAQHATPSPVPKRPAP